MALRNFCHSLSNRLSQDREFPELQCSAMGTVAAAVNTTQQQCSMKDMDKLVCGAVCAHAELAGSGYSGKSDSAAQKKSEIHCGTEPFLFSLFPGPPKKSKI